MKTIYAFTVAIICNAATWAAAVAQSAPQDSIELIQLGGTAGLVASLMAGVIALWRLCREILKEQKAEREQHRAEQQTEREQHKAEVRSLQEQHKNDIVSVTDRYLKDLHEQINMLRADTRHQMEAAKIEADNRYKKQNDQES